jgi:spore maturation protein CgeD
MPGISVIIVSHNKPQFVKEAVQSVLDQTYQDWEAILVDSGVLLKQGFFDYITDKRIRVVPSGETADMGRRVNMASWCFNETLNSGKLAGELILYLCDDDVFYKEAFETFWKYYTEHNREPQAMYASQDIGLIDRQGRLRLIGRRIADRPAGRFCRGRKLDCKVDYLQFCHSRAILDRLAEVYHTTRYHPENRDFSDHADGVFMEKVGTLTKVHNINQLVSMNRRTIGSANLEYSENPAGRLWILVKAKFRGLKRRLRARPRA